MIALIVPLGLDTLGVALALGVAGFPPGRRLPLSLLFAGFETAMPLVGVALGVPLGHAIGSVADYGAAGLLTALGAYVLLGGDDETRERQRLLAISERGLIGALVLGMSISLDELAIGFSAGLLHLPIGALIAAVGVQAFVATQVGVRVGSRVGEGVGEGVERLAGIALIALGAILVAEQLTL